MGSEGGFAGVGGGSKQCILIPQINMICLKIFFRESWSQHGSTAWVR